MILKNGKRIDGCTDTLPVGTVQPFLGLTPPLGYLVCQGQLISKVEYPELYQICGSIFGTETDTHFYLPDLRGKTIAGYNPDNELVNTIGKLLGAESHVHTTGNHTLIESEMPMHTHSLPSSDQYGKNYTPSNEYIVDSRSLLRIGQANLIPMGKSLTESAGSSQPHNHGDTGEASNYQPTIVLNWIVKAAMLIPEYFVVENTLTSTSTSNALSAAQGKILNNKFANYLPLSGGQITGTINYNQDGVLLHCDSSHESYDSTISYASSGDEAMLFATKNLVTSFMFINGEDIINTYDRNIWQNISPALQIKDNKVIINKLIGQGSHATYPLEVNGTMWASGGLIGGDGGTIGSITLRTEYDNEINFGGTSTSDVLFFGYRAADSKPAPVLYTFGASGVARLKAAGYDTSSSRACKENITQANINALDIINNTVITKFNFIADKNKEERIGFIADDTHELLSGINHDKMDLNNCIGVLMKAVQELSQELNKLKEE